MLAHGMRNTVAVVEGTAKHLEHRWDLLAWDEQAAALASLVDHADHLAAGLDAVPSLVGARLGNHCFVIAETAARVANLARDGRCDRTGRIESLQAISRQCRHIDRILADLTRVVPLPVVLELDRLAAPAPEGQGAVT